MSFNPGGTAGDMVRMIDIAERAGVSLGTVSAVLSGRGKSIRFSKEKAEKIRAIAREMNYIPNFSAKMLSGQSSHTLGVLVDSEDVAVRFEQLAAIEREAEQCGYRLLVAEAHRNPEKQLMNYRTLRQYGVDGVICHVNSIHDELRGESGVVLYGAEPVEGFSTVCYDVRSGYAEALAAFEAEGRRNVALAIREQPEFDPGPPPRFSGTVSARTDLCVAGGGLRYARGGGKAGQDLHPAPGNRCGDSAE